MPDVIADNTAFSLELEEGIATLRYRKAFLSVVLDLHTRGEFLEKMDELESDPGVLGLIQINDEEFAGEDEISELMKQLAEPGGRRLSVLHRFKRSAIQITKRHFAQM